MLSSVVLRQLALTLIVCAVNVGGVARAEQVERLRSYWDAEHRTIYSDVVITHDDGSRESARMMGGTVDGIGMLKIAIYGSQPVDFVRTLTTTTKAPLHWAGSCVFLTPSSKGTHDLAQTDVVAAFTAAANAWNGQAASCSYLRFMMQAAEDLDLDYDGKNALIFREDRWAPGGSTSADPYNPAATAITTVRFIDDMSRQDNGTILDTDIEVNAIDYAMAVGCETQCRTMATNGPIEDLQNTLTHELGHVLGLAHTCYQPSPSNPNAPPPLDNTGNPAPRCDLGVLLPKTVTDATMYPFEGPMEISKRTLSQDDIDGDCAIYPTAMDPHVCAAVQVSSGGGCAMAPATSDADGGAFLAGGLLAALGLGRLRRRQGTSL